MKISINRTSTVPIRDQLVEQIGLQIASDILKGEEKLPSIRALAQRLGIHYNTVSSAYNHLSDIGLLEVRQGSGVRVASKIPHREIDINDSGLEVLVRNFLAIAAEHGFSRLDLQSCVQRLLGSKPITRILVVDRNPDFHPLLVSELQPNFKLPVEPVTVDQLNSRPELLSDSLVVTSLYHVFSLRDSNIDPTRLVVCNVEPARAELEKIAEHPAGSLILLVSVSPTLLKMATNLIAASPGLEIGLRSILLEDEKELQYSLPLANSILCDRPSQEVVTRLAGRVPVTVFHLYSNSTIRLIEDRLQKWG